MFKKLKNILSGKDSQQPGGSGSPQFGGTQASAFYQAASQPQGTNSRSSSLGLDERNGSLHSQLGSQHGTSRKKSSFLDRFSSKSKGSSRSDTRKSIGGDSRKSMASDAPRPPYHPTSHAPSQTLTTSSNSNNPLHSQDLTNAMPSQELPPIPSRGRSQKLNSQELPPLSPKLRSDPFPQEAYRVPGRPIEVEKPSEPVPDSPWGDDAPSDAIAPAVKPNPLISSPWGAEEEDTFPVPVDPVAQAQKVQEDLKEPDSEPSIPRPAITPRPSDSADSLGENKVLETKPSPSKTQQNRPETIPFPANLCKPTIIALRGAPKQEFSAAAEERAAGEMAQEATDIEGERIPLKDVHLVTKNGRPVELGEGGFGKVYLGSLFREACAVKTVNQGTRKEQARFLNEIKLLGRLKSKYITRAMGYSVTPEGLLLIMEYVSGGNLFKSLQTGDSHRWYQKGRDTLLSIAVALNVLHSKNIAHLDLKSPNVLLTEHGEAKVADVGLSKLLKNEMSLTSMPGSFPWSAPEQLHGRVGLPSDIWSFGTVIWEVCTGERPPMNRYLRPIKVPEEAPKEVLEVMKRCHNPNTFDRINADQLYAQLEACPWEPRA